MINKYPPNMPYQPPNGPNPNHAKNSQFTFFFTKINETSWIKSKKSSSSSKSRLHHISLTFSPYFLSENLFIMSASKTLYISDNMYWQTITMKRGSHTIWSSNNRYFWQDNAFITNQGKIKKISESRPNWVLKSHQYKTTSCMNLTI